MMIPPRKTWASPSLAAVPGGAIPAYEFKCLVPEGVARGVEAWAAAHLAPDPHADPARGGYRVTSVYFDTQQFDVYRRSGSACGGHKHRARRYGAEPTAHLERKSKRDGRVWKYRTA